MQRRSHHPPHMSANHAELADKIIERVLHHAGNDGWGADALAHAISDLACDENLAHVLFPDVPKSLLIWASGYGDSVMVEWLQDNKPEKITATIFTGLMFRYRHFEPHRAALRRAAAALTDPAHVISAGELTWATADKLWRAAGDDANDFNHYTKRILLSGIIAATLPVYLHDASENLTETENFLRHRLDDVKIINQLKAKIFGNKKNA
ncbi:MAG: COQ9 family protein [Hydrotalea sp.]|nr:COQ9 family protein [Hydrotalea sp.]